VRNGVKIHEAIRSHIGGNGHLSRFRQFFNNRYRGRSSDATTAARIMLAGDIAEPVNTLRFTALLGTIPPSLLPNSKLDPFIKGYVDTIQRLVGQENARVTRLPAANKIS
jgi:hypothetical protein